jgi:hypothetical protein
MQPVRVKEEEQWRQEGNGPADHAPRQNDKLQKWQIAFVVSLAGTRTVRPATRTIDSSTAPGL